MRVSISAVLSAIFLTACSAAPSDTASKPALFPDTVNLALLEGSQIIADCDTTDVLDPVGKNIVCVSIPFPETVQSADDREVFAEGFSRNYANLLSQSGWTVATEWPLFYRFEKAVSDECSNLVQIMTWVVDETKKPEDRNFPTSRITLIENQNPICGDKRKIQ